MRIGDSATYIGSVYPWAAGRQVEIRGVIRDYRTIKEGEVAATDQVIFSLLDGDGFRCSAPDALLSDFALPREEAEVRVEFTTLV